MPQVNHIAVLLVLVLSLVLGFLWYSILFGKRWAVGYRLEEDALKSIPGITILYTLIGALLFSYGVAIFAALLGVDGAAGGALLGLGLWGTIITPRYLLHVLYGRVGGRAILIDVGFDLLVALLAGAVIGGWLPG